MKQAVRRKYHYIYKITRLDESGKYYIGMHSTDDLEDGYFGSGKLITASIKKHGKEKHKKEILEFPPTREALKLREKEIVNEELLGDKRCMNLRLGGDGGWHHINTNRDHNNQEWRQRVSSGTKEGHERNNYQPPGWNYDWTGKKHSTETKAKMAATAKGKHAGEKNSQFGSCWVTNGVKPAKIRKEQLSEYLLNGYSQGRIAERL